MDRPLGGQGDAASGGECVWKRSSWKARAGWPEILNSKRIVETVRENPVFRASPMPIVINEDSARTEKLRAALEVGASWGYYDQGANNYRDGYQSPPVSWGISTPDKQAFFEEVARVTGYPGSSR